MYHPGCFPVVKGIKQPDNLNSYHLISYPNHRSAGQPGGHRALKGLATTNIRRLGSVKNCPSQNMVIVGLYLTYHDYFVLKGVLKHKYIYYICNICLTPEVKNVKKKRLYFYFSFKYCIPYFYTDIFSR